jgi:hypothetical protein
MRFRTVARFVGKRNVRIDFASACAVVLCESPHFTMMRSQWKTISGYASVT